MLIIIMKNQTSFFPYNANNISIIWRKKKSDLIVSFISSKIIIANDNDRIPLNPVRLETWVHVDIACGVECM